MDNNCKFEQINIYEEQKKVFMKKSIEIGSRVKAMREDKKLSKEEVADRAGISVAQIESIEEQNLLPSLAPLIKIARV